MSNNIEFKKTIKNMIAIFVNKIITRKIISENNAIEIKTISNIHNEKLKDLKKRFYEVKNKKDIYNKNVYIKDFENKLKLFELSTNVNNTRDLILSLSYIVEILERGK